MTSPIATFYVAIPSVWLCESVGHRWSLYGGSFKDSTAPDNTQSLAHIRNQWLAQCHFGRWKQRWLTGDMLDIGPTLARRHQATDKPTSGSREILPPVSQRWTTGQNYVEPTIDFHVGPMDVQRLSHHWAKV